jgi:hypothetical protein
MSGTTLFAAVDALVARWRALPGYGTPQESGVTIVYDGPSETGDAPSLFVVVGGRSPWADEDTDDTAGTTDSEWISVPIQAGSQMESLTIMCAVVAQSGADDWTDLRAALASTMDDLETALRTTTPLVDNQITVVLSNGRLSQTAGTEGVAAAFEFDVNLTVLN